MIVVMQIWDGDKVKSVFTAKRLKELYPDVLLGILANNCKHPDEIEDYADIIHSTTEDVFAAGTGGLAAHELLCLGLELPGHIIVKIDPDTIIHPIEGFDEKRLNYKGVFGKMQQTKGVFGKLQSINGGAMGINRNVARLFVDEKILLDEALVKLIPSKVSAYIRQKLEARIKGKLLSSHDWTIAWACEQLKIPMDYDGLITSVFEHEERNMVAVNPYLDGKSIESLIASFPKGVLKDEHLHQEKNKYNNIHSFLTFVWGDNGIIISKKDPETRHLINKEFSEIDEAIKYITFKDSQQMIVMAKPNSQNIQVIIIDLDCSYDCSVDVTTIRTSNNRYHILMRMEPAISEEESKEIIDTASLFADAVGSMEATLAYGCRVPMTPSYNKYCIAMHDSCVAVNKLHGEVELLKHVDKFYTKEEAIDVISQLSKVCKVPLLEIKEELVLL